MHGEHAETLTTGPLPGASVECVSFYTMDRVAATQAAVIVRGVKLRCNAGPGESCTAAIEVAGARRGERWTFDLSLPPGVPMPVPGVRHWLTLAQPGQVPTEFTLRGTLRCAGGAPLPIAVAIPGIPGIPPLGGAAALWIAGDAAPVVVRCTAPSCMRELRSQHGPYEQAGTVQLNITAHYNVSDIDPNVTEMPGGTVVHGALAAVSDVLCVHSNAELRTLAIRAPELLPIVRFPRTLVGDLAVTSMRHLVRILAMTDYSSAVDRIYAEATAAAMNMRAGVVATDTAVAAVYDAGEILAACKPGDPISWNAVKFDFMTCAGFSGQDLLKLLTALIRFNMGTCATCVPQCPSLEME
ncbi:MAG: hypothetical protein M0R22_10830 [Dehalococcoidia bacterium]|nr:hypothetical protein [Dehalococcoidia bacterium]